MRVPGHDQLNSSISARQDGSPTLPGPGPGPFAGWRDMAPHTREGVVKERLSTLLFALGELPGQFGPAPNMPLPGQGLARLIDDICPASTVVIHSKSLPGCRLALEHLVVAPRGLVVVSPEWAPVTEPSPRPAGPSGHGRRSSTPAASASVGDSHTRRRSRVVRETLRRANALRAWLAGTDWAGATLWAAVCSPPMMGPPVPPPVVIDGLWLGGIERLPSWLGSGPSLDGPARAALGYFLAAELPAG